MNIKFKITSGLLEHIHNDLSRKHHFAAERVGFISCGIAVSAEKKLIILSENYYPIADDHYINDQSYGAMMGAPAIRNALQVAYQQPVSMFHVHRHEHFGVPKFSSIDVSESHKYIPDFWKVQPDRPHGIIVLSRDSIAGLCWYPKLKSPIPINFFSVIK